MESNTEIKTGNAVLDVEGMTCGSCARRVESTLLGVPGVTRATVDRTSGRAYVKGKAQLDELTAAVQSAGYSARLSEEDGQQPAATAPRKGGCY